jgi:hypothetical protein
VVKEGRVLRHRDEAAKRRYFGDLLASEEGRWRILGDVVHQ